VRFSFLRPPKPRCKKTPCPNHGPNRAHKHSISWKSRLLAWKRHIIIVVDRPNCMDFIYRRSTEEYKSCFGRPIAVMQFFLLIFIRGLGGPYGNRASSATAQVGRGHSLNPPLIPRTIYRDLSISAFYFFCFSTF